VKAVRDLPLKEPGEMHETLDEHAPRSLRLVAQMLKALWRGSTKFEAFLDEIQLAKHGFIPRGKCYPQLGDHALELCRNIIRPGRNRNLLLSDLRPHWW